MMSGVHRLPILNLEFRLDRSHSSVYFINLSKMVSQVKFVIVVVNFGWCLIPRRTKISFCSVCLLNTGIFMITSGWITAVNYKNLNYIASLLRECLSLT